MRVRLRSPPHSVGVITRLEGSYFSSASEPIPPTTQSLIPDDLVAWNNDDDGLCVLVLNIPAVDPPEGLRVC